MGVPNIHSNLADDPELDFNLKKVNNAIDDSGLKEKMGDLEGGPSEDKNEKQQSGESV